MKYITENYDKDMGKVNWQEGFSKELEGLSIEEQLRCYAWSEYKKLAEIQYTEVEKNAEKKTTI